jgi:hypothetical protein
MLFQPHSMPDNNGQDVHQSEKSEINPLVDPVGLSELLKLSVIEFVLPQDKNYKPESHQLTYLLVVQNVEMDVTEDIHQLLGNISKLPELLPEDYMEIKILVYHIHSNHVNITQLDHYQIVQL